jgi:hypothetical protein
MRNYERSYTHLLHLLLLSPLLHPQFTFTASTTTQQALAWVKECRRSILKLPKSIIDIKPKRRSKDILLPLRPQVVSLPAGSIPQQMVGYTSHLHSLILPHTMGILRYPRLHLSLKAIQLIWLILHHTPMCPRARTVIQVHSSTI